MVGLRFPLAMVLAESARLEQAIRGNPKALGYGA